METSAFYGKRACLSRVIERELERSDVSEDEDDIQETQIDFGSDYVPDDEELDERQQFLNNAADDQSDSEQHEEEMTLPTSSNSRRRREAPLWRIISDNDSGRDVPQWLGHIEEAQCIRRPIEYFRDFFSNDILDHLVVQSNLYALQKNPNKPLKLTRPELEQFLGILFAMSMIKLSNSRLYWNSVLQCPIITESMTRDRWEEIKASIHCNDNSQMPLPNDIGYDKLFKVRPLIDHLKQKFKAIPMPQMLCVDEQIVPFKGSSSLKQYIPSKPHKWGYKIFSLCDSAGFLYDFEVYTGPIKPVEGEPDLGASSNIVLKLAQCIPKNMNYLLYCDNWFTSLPLVTTLAKQKIFLLGTVRQVRLPGLPFPGDKELIKKGRGSHVEAKALVDGTEVRAVKWADNRCVSLVSSFSSAQPLQQCKRYDKKKKQRITVSCPTIVTTYNKFMGGVDLMDALVALYRIHTRSKKYYHKLFFYFMDLALVNSWLLYKRDCKSIGVSNQKVLMLQEFKMLVANALLLQGKGVSSKRGRPSSSSISSMHATKKVKGHATKPIPGSEIRTDGVCHMPEIAEKGGRCKNPTCKGITVFYCEKCKVNLCLTKSRNCFKEFHAK